jgi:hypothetical protein
MGMDLLGQNEKKEEMEDAGTRYLNTRDVLKRLHTKVH